MKKLFGTDGVRGVANQELTCELAMNIGRAAGIVLSEYCHRKPTFLIGKDTRISSDMLENALVAGICSVGADAVILGTISTPAVAVLVNKYKADAGFMISASHNPMEYNGIKIFNNDGYKLPSDLEKKIELLIHKEEFCLKLGDELGKVSIQKNAQQDYINYIIETIGCDELPKIKVALDCANGSASVTARKLFQSLNIDCLLINDKPNGININDKCGSTHMEAISQFTTENNCDIGIAFDGDADRCLIVDENGEIVDGDKIMAIMATHLKQQGKLAKNTVVVTTMSNLGLIKMAKDKDIRIETTDVGDRYVLEKMVEEGYSIGGESSGHIILLDHITTGDGQLVAIHFLTMMKKLGLKVSELSKIMTICPQVLINVKIPNSKKYKILDCRDISCKIDEYEKELGDDGRILLRPSGTEPLVRIMVEGIDKDKISAIATDLSNVVKESLGI